MDYTKIVTDADMKNFMNLVGGFHDGVVKELHMVNSAYIEENLSFVCNHKLNARFLIQRQWANPAAVEILAVDVTHFQINGSEEIYSATGQVRIDRNLDIPEYKINFDHGYFTCLKLWYREASTWLGKKVRFGHVTLPYPPKHVSKIIDDNWIMCEQCCETWEPIDKELFQQCPKCDEPHINPLSHEYSKG